MDRKKKLEASLEGLFSTSKKSKEHAQSQRPATTDAEGAEPAALILEQPETVDPEAEQPVTASPAPEQPVATAPTAEVEDAAMEKEPVVSSPPPQTRSTSSGQAQAPVRGTRIATDGYEEQLVAFTLANEHYGVDIGSVNSTIKMQAITAVPWTPTFVEGITNLRGAVLPVIDLRKRLGLVVGEETKDTRIVVVETNDTHVGLVVDEVTEVLRVAEEALEPPSPVVSPVDPGFITGIAKVGERLIILLDLGRVLSIEEQLGLQTL